MKGNTMRVQSGIFSRRTFMGGAAALGAASWMPQTGFGADAKPNSIFGGVQIGAITYSYRSMPEGAAEVLQYAVNSGISSIELMGGTAVKFAGNSIEKFKDLRKMYADAGVAIHIVKFGNIGNKDMSDDQIDHYFRVAKALGAKGITREISEDAAKRLGPIADKHGIKIGFHNHMQINATTYDGPILSYGKNLAINLDIGHYVAVNDDSVVALIEKYRDRIISLHLKDRKSKANKGTNMPFGEGDTPITGVLQYLKKNKLPIHADIELEYPIPKDSNAVQEVAKCVQFCKQALA
ncbi:MAG: sugar phosphate isomerase/epimerase [Kiritimatiellia bacterium]